MIADGVLGRDPALHDARMVGAAHLRGERRDVKTSRIKYENAQKTRRILIEPCEKNGLDEGTRREAMRSGDPRGDRDGLRAELDARGIEWVDASEERGEGYPYHMERTRFCARGGDFSCIWGHEKYRRPAHGANLRLAAGARNACPT